MSVLLSLSALACILVGAQAQTSRQPKAVATQPGVISLESLLREMADVEAIARWPHSAYTNREASSYDRRQITPRRPGWSANDDFTQFIRTEENKGRQEQVMLDTDGPGALVRFWLTAAPPKEGTLRIYLDGSREPSLVFDAFDLEDGPLQVPAAFLYRHESYSANGGGNTLYLPIPYAKHCKVTWQEGARASQRYYQINYRTYPIGTPVKTWTPQQVSVAKPLLERVGRRLEAPPQTVPGRVQSLNQKLAQKGSVVLDLPAGPSAVRTLELLLDAGPLSPNQLERALRSVIIQMSFDGERTVWCPATDFFGSGVGINELRSLHRSVGKDGTMRCRWVMPYRKNARITLTNLGTSPVQATLHATTSPWKWDSRSMLFHTNWHYESGMKTITMDKVLQNTDMRDWNFVDIKGRGVYVGDSLALFNDEPIWYGEGDEKIFVDGEKFPSHPGTGTEDYYGYSYAPRGLFQSPFANQNRVDVPATNQGVSVMGRTRPLDAIPFKRSLQFDMELTSYTPTVVTYAATSYWYAFPGATSSIVPQPEAAVLPIQTLAQVSERGKLKPGAIEVEGLKVVRNSPSFTPEAQDMSPWDSRRWSSRRHLLGKATQVGDFVELEVPAPDNSPRQIVLHATRAKDFGILRFTVNGQASDAVFDGYSAEVVPGGFVNLGIFKPRGGKYLLRIEVSGSNPHAQEGRRYFGLDYLELTTPGN
jgi:hypothetical protein